MIVEPASGGHAGEAGPVTVLPHELMEAAVVLGIIGLILIALGVVGLWLLVKIHRRVTHSPPGRSGTPSPPPSSSHDRPGHG